VTVSTALPLVSITGNVIGVTVSVTVSGEGDGIGDRLPLPLQYLALISSGHGDPITGKGRLSA